MNTSTVLLMVRKTVWVGILASAMMVWMVGTATAAPTTTSLSSWESTVVDGQIVGGERTVVVTNTTGQHLSSHTMDLGPAPCDCAIVEASVDHVITDNAWVVPELDVGETASLTLRYGTPDTTQAAASTGTRISPLAVFAAALLAATAAMTLAGHRRLTLAL